MSEQTFSYAFEHDSSAESFETNYVASDVQYVPILDSNQNNYASGFVRFTNVSLTGSNVEKQLDFSQGYLLVPYQVDLDLIPAAGNTTAFHVDADYSQAGAIALKGNHHIIDSALLKYNNINVNKNSEYANIVANEKLKLLGEDEFKLHADVLNFDWDASRTLDLVSNGAGALLGERNNFTVQATDLSNSFKPGSQPNVGHIERMRKTNIDLTSIAKSTIAKFSGKTGELLSSVNQNCLYSVADRKIVFCGMACIPLVYVHDAFKNIPTVGSALGMDLTLRLNIAQENVYTVTYTTAHALNGISAQQIVGHTCPWLISPPSQNGATGLRIFHGATHNSDYQIRVTSRIGWGVTAHPGCRIMVPSVNYTTEYLSKIIKQPTYTWKYTDYSIDYDQARLGGSQVIRQLNMTSSHIRNIYIIPFLSRGASHPSALESIISSAPTTCTPVKLSDVQLSIGGSPLYSERLSYVNQFYNNNLFTLLGDKMNGNHFKSAIVRGQVKRSDWEHGYGVYCFNLKKTADEVQDALPKTLQLNYRIEADNTKSFDFYYIVEHESVMYIDRASGQVTSALQ